MAYRKELESLFSDLISETPDEVLRGQLEQVLSGADSIVLPEYFLVDGVDELKEDGGGSLFTIIAGLPLPAKIKLALGGNKMARAILVRDTNKQIPLFVLENPQITENEIYEIAKNANIDDSVLRTIASNPKWMKSYQLKLAIVSNPKLPIDLSIKWVKFLQDTDLRKLSRSKNIPQVLASQCLKLLTQRVN